ncbi:MAG: gamma-glutamyl-gamma-aminobutyrate hydrolase family protein [Armatimonadota bacterium]
MPQPAILITSGRHNQTAQKTEVQSVLLGCSIHYIEAILRAGGAPIILPPVTGADSIRTILERVDGVILSGGGDVLSLEYGEEPHPKSHYHDPSRDKVEIEVVRQSLEMNLPVLGICRGIQLLNIALGGTLYQDVPSQVKNAVKHYSQGVSSVLLHSVDIEPGSILSKVSGTNSMAVNSRHHQAVKDLGDGLVINCRAKDGVIEGVEFADGRPILGVQYHPEECADIYPGFQEIFD